MHILSFSFFTFLIGLNAFAETITRNHFDIDLPAPSTNISAPSTDIRLVLEYRLNLRDYDRVTEKMTIVEDQPAKIYIRHRANGQRTEFIIYGHKIPFPTSQDLWAFSLVSVALNSDGDILEPYQENRFFLDLNAKHEVDATQQNGSVRRDLRLTVSR